MVRVVRWKAVLVAALFVAVAPASGLAANEGLSPWAPRNSFFYLETSGFTAFEEPFKETALFAIWREPQVETFLKKPLGDFKARIEAGESNWPLLWPEVRNLLDGPVALSVFSYEKDERVKPAAVVLARPPERAAFLAATGKLVESAQEGKLERLFAPLYSGNDYSSEICQSNVRRIGRALDAYAEDHQGRLPPTLIELHPKYLRDTWDLDCAPPEQKGYVYVPGLDTRRFPTPEEIMVVFDRYGNHEDGRTVLFMDGAVTFMTEAELQQALAKQPNADVILTFEGVAAQPAEPPTPADAYTIGSFRVQPFGEDAEGPAHLLHKDVVVVGFSRGSLEAYVEWLGRAERDSLAEKADYKSMLASLRPKAAVLTGFLDLQVAWEADPEQMSEEQEEFISALGLDALEWMGGTVHCDPPGFQNRLVLHCPGERTGLLALVPTGLLSEDLFAHVPKFSPAAAALCFDAAEAYDVVRQLTYAWSESGGESFDSSMADFAEETGLDLRDGLLAALGREYLMYVTPSPLSPVGLDAALLIPDSEGGRMKTALASLADYVRTSMEEDGTGTVESSTVGEHTLYMVRYRGQVPLAPAFGVVGNTVVASLFPGSAQAQMRMLSSGPPDPSTSILASERFKETRARVSPGGSMVSYLDAEAYIDLAYRGVMQLWTFPTFDPPFEATELPQPEAITKHLGGACSMLRVGEQDIVLEEYSPLIINPSLSPQSLALMGGITYAASRASHQEYAAAEVEGPECVSNLKNIGLALAIYANDHEDKYPPTLEDLLAGYLPNAEALQCPSDSSDERSYLYVPGLSVAHEPTAIVMFERKGNHAGGRNVLFGDGHVEWMSEEAFQRRWAEQRQKYDLPALKELGDRIEEE